MPSVASQAAVPASLPDAAWRGPVHEAAPDSVLIGIPGLGRALVRSGEAAALELCPGTDELDSSWLLEVPVAHAAALLEGRFALRASGVSVGGRAVALAGPGASGKSAVAAALALRGHRVLSDGALEVSVERDGATALPSGGRVGLWPDMVERLGLAAEDGEAVRTCLPKRRFDLGAAAEAAPLVLVALLHPRSDLDEGAVQELRGAERVAHVLHQTVLASLVEAVGLETRRFRWAVRMAAAVRVVRVGVEDRKGDPERTAATIEELLA